MKKKIAITFPHLHEFGGGEIFCEYVSNLLSKKYLVYLYYYEKNNINNRLKFNKKIKIKPLKCENKILNYFYSNYIFLAQLYLIYFFFKNSLKFHLVFSGAGEFFSKNNKVYQYIHHPFYSLNPMHYLAIGTKIWEIHKFILRLIVSFFVRIFFLLNKKKLEKNLTIVNSKWTRSRFNSIYKNSKTKLIYPTFKIQKFENYSKKKLAKKNNNFVLVGRVGPDKRTFEAINFFIKFKKKYKFLDIGKLLVIGPSNNKFQNRLNLIKIKYKKVIKILGYLSWKKQNNILKNSKFGIHFCKYEHFGRAIVEMQKKAVIVFAHRSGGCVETVNQKFCTFLSDAELEKKLLYVIKNKNVQNKIYNWNKHKFLKNFSTNIFDSQILNYIK